MHIKSEQFLHVVIQAKNSKFGKLCFKIPPVIYFHYTTLEEQPSGSTSISASWDSNWHGNLFRVECTDLKVNSPMTIKSIPEGKSV